MQQPQALTHDGNVAIAVGASRRAVSWKVKEMPWSQFVAKLATTTRTPETVAEYIAMSRDKKGDVKDIGGFVGGTLKGGRRKAHNVLWRQLVTLDIDFVKDADATALWAKIKALGYACVVYSTHSHTPEAARLRLIVPTDRPMRPDEYEPVARRIAGDVGVDYFDDSTYEPHRLMYWPSTPCDGEYFFRAQDAAWLGVDAQLARYGDWKDPAQWIFSGRRSEVIKGLAAKQGDPLSKKGVVGAFCRSFSVEDAMARFIPDAYTPCGEGRYTYAGGSTVGGLIVYDDGRFIYSHHGTDPCGGLLCNAFDMVRLHLFGDKDEDTPPDAPAAKQPSYKAMAGMCIELDEVKAELSRMRMESAVDAFSDADENWATKLRYTNMGLLEETRENMRLILRNDPELKDKFAYDAFRLRPVVLGDLPWRALAERAHDGWTDTDDAALRNYLEARYGLKNVGKSVDAFEIAVNENTIHPVRQYLEGLKWDGVERLDEALVDYFGAEKTPYTLAVTRKCFCGAVARVFKPGCKFDYMLVLAGPQGIGKSTFFRKMGGRWFSDSLTSVSGKEAYEQLQGYWILEMGELSAMRKAEIEATKLFITKQEDNFRAAYAHRTEPHPRQCIFVGTTNDAEFLHDQTGGRRFWPVNVDKGLFSALDMTQETVDQLWAEAVARYKAGEPLYLSMAVETDARAAQESHTETDIRMGMVEEYLNTLLPEDWAKRDLAERRAFFEFEGGSGTVERERVCVAEVWAELFRGDIGKCPTADSRAIANMLLKLGWVRMKNVYRVSKVYGLQKGFEKCKPSLLTEKSSVNKMDEKC